MLFNESMKTIDEIRKENLGILVKTYGGVGKLADVLERSSSQVSQWLNSSKASASGKPRRFNSDSARYIEDKCGKPEGWLDTPHQNESIYSQNNTIGTVLAPKQTEIESAYTLVSAENTESQSGKIEYWDVKGSCGGGFLNYEQMPKGHLIKEASFFNKYGLKPENAFAIYADGDSMAEFIVDGDIVIFDKSKTEPKSGEIFAIEHPDGLRIKVLRRSIDGTWTLESKNPDKRKYPDEVIPPGSHDLLKIHGQFIYRQGGYG